MEKIGILGTGTVAQTLAKGFVSHDYDVVMGTRTPKDSMKTFTDTAKHSDLLVLAVKGTAAKAVLQEIGADNLKGKTIIDVTNPIAEEPPTNGVLKFFTTLDKSLMEQLQEAYPQSHFVKAFNSIGAAHMINPQFDSTPTMFICGNNGNAKQKVIEIVRLFGFEPEDMGKAEAARAIEPLCMLWCIPGFLHNEWNHAFKLLKKTSNN